MFVFNFLPKKKKKSNLYSAIQHQRCPQSTVHSHVVYVNALCTYVSTYMKIRISIHLQIYTYTHTTAVQGLRFSCYSWAPEPRHPVHVTDVYTTESRTPLVRELSADRFSVGLLLHCSPPSRVRAGEWAKMCGGQALLWSAASAEKQHIFFLFRLQPARHHYSLAHSTAHMNSGQSTK